MQIPSDATPLQTGDIILVTGKHSHALVKAQKIFVPSAVSSHVVIAHAETVCIDAVPKDGVRNRFLTDIFENVEDDWRVIRKKSLSQADQKNLLKASAFFLFQSYLIHPSEKIGKYKSYCSELARKIFARADVPIDVPKTGLVMPAHFDLLQQNNSEWFDVTTEVKSWFDVLRDNETAMRFITQTFISGLKLNRKRFFDRERTREQIRQAAKAGKLSPIKLQEAIAILDKVDSQVTFRFWDAPGTKAGT